MSVFLYDNLSVEQRRFCALELKTPGSPCRVVVFAVRFSGKLDQNALQRAVNAIVERHSALRTIFSVEDERTIPAVLPPGPVGISEENWTQLQAGEVDSFIERRIHQEYQKPFPFPAGPFLRLSLLCFGPDHYLFIAAAHASVFDYPSADIFRTELLKFYEAHVRGEPSSMPNFTSQEPDSGYWRRQFLAGVTKDTHLAYWKNQLSGDLANLQMPADRPRQAVAPPPSASMPITLEGAVFEALLRYSEERGTAPKNTLLAAFFILLYRYTYQEDILVGIPVTGRATAETKGRIGRLSYPLVIRSGLSGDLDFASLLEQIGRTLSESEENGDVPFGQLREGLRDSVGPEDSSRHPLFQALFNYVDLPESWKADGIDVIPVSAYHPESEVDLGFHIEFWQRRARISAHYSKDLYDAGTIERMLTHFQNILSGALSEPNRPISQLEILSPAEKHQILKEWNQTSRIYPVDIGIHRLFELQAERTPEQQALLFAGDGSSLTYAKLDRQANLVARKLISLGARPETIVAISMDRSLEMIIGILGILKAGAAFLPIDPAYPKDRVIFMLTDAQAPILLTQKKYAGELSSYVHNCVCLDTDWGSIAGGNDTNPRVPVSDRNLAYVIYTSGSTGRPKGVLLEHRGLCNLAPIQQRLFDLKPGVRVLQFATFSFDASIWEMVMALTAGGTLVLAPSQMLLPGPYLADLLNAQKIDVVTLPPSALSVMAPEELLRVQTIIVAGEACPAELSERWSKDRKFFNAYGPTESTICATIQLCDPEQGRAPIGRPLDNVEAYILDQSGEPVPMGVVGELCIGGITLARGYLNRPDLSEKRFIAHPFSNRGGDRIYKTGDLARWLSDGRIDYIGRADHQVKVRGYRIELEEIENILGRHPKIREQVVIVREDAPGDKRIVAYVVVHSGETATVKELRQYMEKYLPVFMIPSAVVFMEQMPLSPNGKVNRKALPQPRVKVKEQTAGITPSPPLSAISAITIDRKLNLPVVQEPVAPVLDYALVERVLSQHYAIRKAIVAAHSAPGKEKQRITAYWFGRGTTTPKPGELKSYLEKKLPPELMPDELINIATEQERFCAMESAEPGNPLCIRVYVHRLLGALDGKAFRASVDDTVRRSSILRTTFPSVDGRATRTVERAMTIDVEELNLSLLPESEWEGEILREVEDELSRPFNMVAGPLLRLTLLRFSRDEHVLVMASHAAIMDERSSELFLCEVFNAYAREREERGRMVSEPPASLDEARRIRQWLYDADIAAHLPFWIDVFSRSIPEMEWPQGKRSGTGSQLRRYASASMVFEDSLRARLEAVSSREGFDFFTLLFTAYSVLLHRYTDQEDLLIGTPVSGRFWSLLDRVLGGFSYPVIVRVAIEGSISFRQAMKAVADSIALAQQHKSVPLATVEQALSLTLERGHEKLLPAMLELRLDPPVGIDVGGIHVSRIDLQHVNPCTDLYFSIVSGASGLCTRISYNTERFEQAAVERMLEHWYVLLEGIACNPGDEVGLLPLLSQRERGEMLVKWNEVEATYPADMCAHTLFEECCDLFPNDTALIFEGMTMTYAELERAANQFAHMLRGKGVGPDVLVGVCLERSMELIITILGILKAGGAFLPLDPTYPPKRLQFMCADSNIPLVIVSRKSIDKIEPGAAKIQAIETMQVEAASYPDFRLDVPMNPLNLAYAIYTSGSTGRPKGILIHHRGWVNLAFAEKKLFGLQRGVRVLQFTKISFDVSVWEITMSLFVGGTLVLAPQEALMPGPELLHTLQSNEINIVTVPPSALAVMNAEELPHLRILIAAGEACAEALVTKWAAERRFFNAYGPTEITVCATADECFIGGGKPFIGRPLQGVELYVLDAFLNPVPIGIPGELYIGGIGLARGYLNRAELTAERFIPNPFPHSTSTRLYRTGDKVRLHSDGRVDFLGRYDAQIKIRGFRIEPGEVEELLSSHPGIRYAVLRAWENRMGDAYLAAYVSLVPGSSMSIDAIRSYISSRLPGYMVPAVIVIMDELPLAPNGKIDRKALPEPEDAGTGPDDTSEAGSELERAVAGIWAGALGHRRISLDDDFYGLGGHSLAMMRIRARILERYGVNIPIDAAFRCSTAKEMAQLLEGSQAEKSRSSRLKLSKVDRTKVVPLSYSQQQLWLLLQSDPGNPVYNEPFTVTIRGPLDVDILERSIAEIVHRHEILRVVFSATGKNPMQVVAPEQPFAVGRFDLTNFPKQERNGEAVRLAMIEARQPFSFSRGPLFRATLIKLDSELHKLFVVMHHMITDSISAQVIFRNELRSNYNSLLKGEPSPFGELPIHYLDFAVWQRKLKVPETLLPHIEFWERKLSGAPMIELPLDYPRPPQQSFAGAKYYSRIDGRVIQALIALAEAEESTLFMVLLAAFDALLVRYSGQCDIIVGTAVSEREVPEAEPLIGNFINSMVLRMSLSGNPSFRELVRRARETTIEAFAHHEVPFEMLVEELRLSHVRSHNPIFQVGFVLEPTEEQDDENWSVSQHEVDNGTSKTDLTVHIEQRADYAMMRFEYSTALFKPATIERMASGLAMLLQSAAANPDLHLSELSIMPDAERQAIIEHSDVSEPVYRVSCLHELFEEQARIRPQGVALIFPSERMTYEELDKKSNQLASFLRDSGIGTGHLVGLWIDRDAAAAIGILAILKAGAAYVPLDPNEPGMRLNMLLHEAKPTLILTKREHFDKAISYGAQVVCIDSDAHLWAHLPESSLQVKVQPRDLAYVLFNIAPSGRPRGVTISHENIIHLFEATRGIFKFCEDDVWTGFHSCNVDFSVWEMWGALLYGGTLVGISYEVSRSPEAFYAILLSCRVTVLNHTPSAFRHLMMVEESPDAESWRLKLRLVFLGGEALDMRMLKPWFERHGDISPEVYNLYGLTAATGLVSVRRVQNSDTSGSGASNIGKPIPGASAFVLDPYLQLVPVGVFGELFIGGKGLSQGYYNNAELTAERFVQHPFKYTRTSRLYRTGDRARYLDSGEIEYAGRIDHHIRVRGFRIDPNEIEAVLVGHPLIREASVIVREDRPGDQRLVAYYVRRSEQALTTNELRGFLRSRLPDYMIPTLFMAVPSISFVSNGKVDRRTLPAPDRNRPSMAPVFRLPSNAVEVLLRTIWVRLLQVDEIGVKDDFFSLGGHSLLAAQMIAHVRETFRIHIQHSNFLMRMFLENPTIAAFAGAIDMVREATPTLRARHMTVINFEAEAALDTTIGFDAPLVKDWSTPKAILLTGATGFLGSFLLRELLDRTSAKIYCLVRASGERAGLERIQKSMIELGIWSAELASRIVALPGDQSQLLLGLSPSVFEELSESIDIIYHNGAQVNFIYPYSALKASNVRGTCEIIRLATARRKKPVHYISTLAIFAGYGFFGIRSLNESVLLEHADHLFMGYPETKWVSEKMLMNASKRGLPISIYRPHDVTGHAATGVWRTDGFLCSFLKALIELKCAPDINLPLDFAPIDFVVGSIAHLSLHRLPSGEAFHLNNPRYRLLPWLIERMRAIGYSVDIVPHPEWVRRLLDHTTKNPSSVIAPFAPLFVEKWGKEQVTMLEMYAEERIPRFECEETMRALAGTGLVCPPVDEPLLNKYLDYFIKIGFIDRK